MKRLNPVTGKPFVQGDVRVDGRLFLNYCSTVKKDGYFVERWLNKNSFNKQKEIKKTLAAKRYEANKDHILATGRLWELNNPHKRNVIYTKRRASKLQRTPNWLTGIQLQDIEDFYTIAKMFQMYTGEQYHVDHIVPLQGKKVSGLHVPWNLQVIPAKDNLSKGNRH